MTYPVLGLQAPITFWCRDIVERLAGHSGRKARVAHHDAAGGLLCDLMAGSTRPVVSMTRPDAVVREALRCSGLPYILAADSPSVSAAHLASHNRFPPFEALRSVLGDLAELIEMVGSDRALVITESDLSAPGGKGTTASRIASHLGLPIDLAAEAALGGCAYHAVRPLGAILTDSEADDGERATLSLGLAGLEDVLVTGRYDRLVAGRQLFKIEATGQPPVEPVDATGRSGLLIYGPHIALPMGDWTARCILSFSRELIGSQFSVDVVYYRGRLHDLARTSFAVTSAGRLDVNVRFLHADPTAQLEVRLFSDRAVFDGSVSLGSVEFRRNIAAPHSAAEFSNEVDFA